MIWRSCYHTIARLIVFLPHSILSSNWFSVMPWLIRSVKLVVQFKFDSRIEETWKTVFFVKFMECNKEAEMIPINGSVVHKPVEASMSNAMAYYKTNYRYTSMQHLDKYSAGSEFRVFICDLQNLCFISFLSDHYNWVKVIRIFLWGNLCNF